MFSQMRVAPRLDDHAAAHRRVLGQVGAFDDLLIPLGVVLGARRRDCGPGFVHKAGKDNDYTRRGARVMRATPLTMTTAATIIRTVNASPANAAPSSTATTGFT